MGEVGLDREVGTDAGEHVVDGQPPERLLEPCRSPPVVALQRVVAQVHEPSVMTVPVEIVLGHPTGQAVDALRQRRLRGRAGDEPRVFTEERLDGGQRYDEITEPEGHRRHVDATHA
jgi:hypothetical protein